MADQIEIQLNGEAKQIDAESTVQHLLESVNLHERRVAVMRNDEIVPRASYRETKLSDSDKIEIISLAGGG
jgi:thiamine biosynthesis protein ThiS